MNNVRIAIRDSTDSHNVAFFDNVSGIRYQSANLQRFLAGSASILTIEYNSKDIDTIRTGCKLAFIYKQHAYWLNIMDLSKKGYKVEITAYSLGLELNQEERGAHKPANAMSFVEYLAYYDPEHALEIGVNEVADKRIKLEWTGTDTILARLFSIANSFDAEFEFTVELNQDYSLKRQVLNIYKKGNLGSNRAASPIRVGRGLKVINYSDNLKELHTAVRATGKDGLTIDGLNKKVYDDDGNLLYYSNGMTVYAPQSRDKYPSVGKKSSDNWIIKELGETEYSTKEALWGYMLGELKKICVPEITYDIEGAVDGDVGDTRTLIDDVHYDPPLYVQGRISELTEDLITGKVTKSTLTNFERKYSQVASELLKQVEQLANELTQTANSITASVSSVEAKADNAQTTANSAVSKANAAQTAVNTLDSEVVKSASLNLDNNGFVTKVGKTIDGNKFATMIAQNANNVKIIADEMQVTADMIVDGAVTAEKLDVNNLSAVNSDLGEIKGGSLLLQENKTASSSVDNWGTFNRPAHKQGLYMDNHGLASSGAIQRKNGGETTPTDMPLAVLQSGELRFLVVDYNDNLENVLHYGLSDPDYGAIRFEIDSELKRRLTMTSSGYLNFQATNYTNWQSTGVSGCEYMIQGRLVLVNYDVTFNSAGTHTIGGIPQEFTKKSLMMTAKAWTITPRDKNIQLNSDGSLHILDAEANVNYRGTLVFSY